MNQPGKIRIQGLEVLFRVGVPEAERQQPQRLLLDLELEFNFSKAAAMDDVQYTVDYDAVARRIRAFGTGREWKLIETLASDLAGLLKSEFGIDHGGVQVRKFIIAGTEHVAVELRF